MRFRFSACWLMAIALLLGQGAATAQPAQDAARLARAAVPVLGAAAQDTRFQASRWGLDNSDLSLLDDDALLAKSRAAGHGKDFKPAADAGDPYAAYLLALQLTAANDMEHAVDYIDKAARLGLVRAVTTIALSEFAKATNDQEVQAPYKLLNRMASTGNAHCAFWFGQALMRSNQTNVANQNVEWTRQGLNALSFSATAGYAPAQLMVAAIAFEKAKKGAPDQALLRQARELLAKAVAQGNADAIAYAKAHPDAAASK